MYTTTKPRIEPWAKAIHQNNEKRNDPSITVEECLILDALGEEYMYQAAVVLNISGLDHQTHRLNNDQWNQVIAMED